MDNCIVCSNLTTTSTGVVLLPNRTIKNLENTGDYKLICACNIPNATANLPVYIQAGTVNIPVLCKYGNTVLANMLNKRVAYPIGYGNENPAYTDGQFVILSCGCLNKRGTESVTNSVEDGT